MLLGAKRSALILSYFLERKYLCPKYDGKVIIEGEKYFKGIVFMSDGLLSHGGLSDRLRGLVSLFIYCSKNNIPFAVNFCSPFELNDYLIPNEYSWEIKSGEIVKNRHFSRPVIIRPYSIRDDIDTYELFEKRLRSYSNYRQIHVYSNTTLYKDLFGEYFRKLFKPTNALQSAIDTNVSAIGEKYVSVTFRFQQLLGDLKEGNYKVLPKEQREQLIEKCLMVIQSVKEHNKSVNKILVTSDSYSFLKIAKETYEYVVIVAGKVFHMDYSCSHAELAYMKSFVDLYMISMAEKVYVYSTGDMYRNSAFAETASLIGGVPFIRLNDDSINY
jgi:hypothetical protein